MPAAREAVALVTNPSTCLIDASTAHRTASDWVFGLPELAADQRARIRALEADRQPGLPLDAASSCSCGRSSTPAWCRRRRCSARRSITGYSGGGRKMIEQYEAGGDPRLDVRRGPTA